MLRAARWKYRTQKLAKNRHLQAPSHNFLGLYLRNKACIDNSEKNLLRSNISSTRSHKFVNFGPLADEIGPVVWGTPANFNGFRVLAALLHGTPVLGVRQALRR